MRQPKKHWGRFEGTCLNQDYETKIVGSKRPLRRMSKNYIYENPYILTEDIKLTKPKYSNDKSIGTREAVGHLLHRVKYKIVLMR